MLTGLFSPFSGLRSRMHLLPALKFVWASSARWTLLRALLVLVQGTLPLLLLYVLKLVIDRISLALTGPDPSADLESVLLLLGLFGLLNLVNHLAMVTSDLVNTAQAQQVTDYMQNLLLEKSVAADLEYYENSDYYDKLQRAQQEAAYRPSQILNRLVQLSQGGILLVGVTVLLVSLHWVLAVLIILGALPAFLVRLKFANVLYRWQRRRTALERQSVYLGLMLTTDIYAKEVRLFNLGPWLRRRYRDIRRKIYRETLAIVSRRSLATFGTEIVSTALTVSVFAFIAYYTLSGRLKIGDLVLYQQALQRGEGALSNVLRALSGLYEDNLFLTHLKEFLTLEPKIVEPACPLPCPSPFQTGITLSGVTFQYANTERTALQNINLSLPVGQTIALVGENGSGKTTLIKLLCRLYDPTLGQICIDGIDIRQFSTADLRRRISVIFQDYVKYPFTAQENIWLGNIDLDPEDPKILEAAKQSQADSVIQALPLQYQTNLGKLFEAGEELSVGQWQKIALARAFVRDADLIVLDEPTSAMDPKAEYEVFQQFRTLTQGQTAILISHRMSTVRMADRIYVMDQGQIIESGTHEELMNRNGQYAILFNAQAKNYH